MKRWRTMGVGLLMAGCSNNEPIHPAKLAAEGPVDELVVYMHDGRIIELEGAFLHYDRILGRVAWCREAPAAGEAPPIPFAACPEPGARAAIDLRAVRKMEGQEGLSAGETAGIVGGAVAGALLVGGAVALGVVASEMDSGFGGGVGGGSCPRLYSFNGESWQLDSGTYGAAYFEAHQQTDHDLLEKLAVVDGQYRLRLMNELDETEHVDAVTLSVVDHPAGSAVVPAPDRSLLSFTAARAPMRAADFRGSDALEAVARRDDRPWQSDLSARDPQRDDDVRDGLRLAFAKPRGARVMKLWLTGHNTRAASMIVEHLIALQGDAMPALYDTLNDNAVARGLLRRLIVEVGLLTVSVRTAGGWSQRGVLEAAGNEVMKSQALRIPLDDVAGDEVELRLESAVGMWLVDRVAADFSPDVPLVVQDLSPRVVTRDGRDASDVLGRIDGQRLSSERGDWAALTFTAPAAPAAGLLRSIVVHTTGYDTLHVAPAPEPDPAAANALMLSPMATSRRALELMLSLSPERGAP